MCGSIVAKDKTTVDAPFIGAFPSDYTLRRRKSKYISSFTGEIPVNYIGEFWEIFEPITPRGKNSEFSKLNVAAVLTIGFDGVNT